MAKAPNVAVLRKPLTALMPQTQPRDENAEHNERRPLAAYG